MKMKLKKLAAFVTSAIMSVAVLSSVTAFAENQTETAELSNSPAITINEVKPIAEGMYYLYYSFSYSNWDGQDITASIYDDSGNKMFDDGIYFINKTDGSFNSSIGFFDIMVEAGKTYVLTLTSADGAVSADYKFTAYSSVENYGDINGDGMVTTADVGLVNSYAKGAKKPADEQFLRADINGDFKITTADVGMINLKAKSGSQIDSCDYEATVLEVRDGKVLTVDAYLYSNSETTEAWLEYGNNAEIDPDIAVGDKVKITASSIIVETAPPILTNVISVVKIAE